MLRVRVRTHPVLYSNFFPLLSLSSPFFQHSKAQNERKEKEKLKEHLFIKINFLCLDISRLDFNENLLDRTSNNKGPSTSCAKSAGRDDDTSDCWISGAVELMICCWGFVVNGEEISLRIVVDIEWISSINLFDVHVYVNNILSNEKEKKADLFILSTWVVHL